MMFRMSTLSSDTSGLPGLTMKDCARKMKASAKILEAAAHQCEAGATPVAGPRFALFRRQRQGQTSQPEKQRSGGAAEDIQVAERHGVVFGLQCPRVEHVGLNHDEDGDAARPVNVGAPDAAGRGPLRA